MSISTVTYRGYGAGGGVDARVRRGFAAYTGLLQPAPAGFQYTVCSSTTFVGLSLQQGAFPFIVVGDIFITPLVTSPSGYAIQVNGDGTIQILSGNDTSRQSFQYQIYRVASNTIDGPAPVWINEVGPSWNAAVNLTGLALGAPIAPINLAAFPYATSPSGDALTISLASGVLPPGIGLSSGSLSGTPTAIGSFIFAFNATDSAGVSTLSPTCQMVVTTTGGVVSASIAVGPQADILNRLQQLMPHGWFH